MKRTPLLRKTALKSDPEKIRAWQQESRRPLPKVSAKQAIKNRAFARAAAVIKKESPYCARCAFYGREVMGTQTHHIGGRVGQRMADKSLLVRVCDSCHFFVENNWNAAVAEGFMISKHQVTK